MPLCWKQCFSRACCGFWSDYSETRNTISCIKAFLLISIVQAQDIGYFHVSMHGKKSAAALPCLSMS